MKKLLFLLSLLAVSNSAPAQQYGIHHTFWNVTDFTNATATATNLASAASLTRFGDFTLWVLVGVTNPAAGTLDVRWDTSADGTSFPVTNNPAVPGSSGWFSIPLTNSGTKIPWTTNITLNSVGYWRLNWLTNASGQSVTSITVRAYVKPKRNG